VSRSRRKRIPPRTRGLSIRTKLLLVSLALLLIPWMGYQYVRDMKGFLLQGQENALSLTARAVSTVLHDRPELFDPETGAPQLIGEPTDIFAYPLPNHIRLDGDPADWGEQLDRMGVFDGSQDQLCGPDYHADALSFGHLVGYRGPYLYVLFEVTDERLIFRDRTLRRLDNSDHLRLSLQSPGGDVTRYLLTARQPGRMSVYLMDESWRYPVTGEPNYDIAAELGHVTGCRHRATRGTRTPQPAAVAFAGNCQDIAWLEPTGGAHLGIGSSTARAYRGRQTLE
jgi:hypothetical protein